jgi:uncharacterized protein YbjT (DUF2867 family)
MSVLRNVAFIGATGLLGAPVARALAAEGFNVTAMVRDPTVAQSKQLSNIRLVAGNMNSPVDLKKLLTGQDAVYLNLSIKQTEKEREWHTEREGMTSLLAVARETGIKRIFYLSALLIRYEGMNGFRWWVFQLKYDAIKAVKNSGIPYTIFYPSTFMEALTSQYKQGSRMLLAGTSKFPQYFIAVDDYARQVVNAFKNNTTENKEYVVQGPQPLTTDEAVGLFVEHYPKGKLTISRAPFGLIKLLGRISQKLDYGSHIIEALNNYPEKFEADNTWSELGKPTITIREFAART